MTSNTWILIGLAVVLSLIVVRSLFQFRSYRATLRRQMFWPFTTGALVWTVFTVYALDGMFCFLVLAAIAGIYGPYLLWMLRHSDDPAA